MLGFIIRYNLFADTWDLHLVTANSIIRLEGFSTFQGAQNSMRTDYTARITTSPSIFHYDDLGDLVRTEG